MSDELNFIAYDGGDLHLEGREANFLMAVLEFWVKERPEGNYRPFDEVYADTIYRKLSLRGQGLLNREDERKR